MIKDKVTVFLNSIKGTEVDGVDELFEDLIVSAGEYVSSAISLEAGIVCGRLTKASNDYREYISKLNNKKDKCHTSFVNNIKIINRSLKKFNFPLIFEGDEENKPEIEKFALSIVREFTNSAANEVSAS